MRSVRTSLALIRTLVRTFPEYRGLGARGPDLKATQIHLVWWKSTLWPQRWRIQEEGGRCDTSSAAPHWLKPPRVFCTWSLQVKHPRPALCYCNMCPVAWKTIKRGLRPWTSEKNRLFLTMTQSKWRKCLNFFFKCLKVFEANDCWCVSSPRYSKPMVTACWGVRTAPRWGQS